MVIFDRLATLLLPPDGSGMAVEADEWWDLAPAVVEAGDPVIWGRPPLPAGADGRRLRRFAGDRRKALGRLRRRPPGGMRVVDSVWWPPPRLGGSRVKQSLKDALGSGALLSLSRGGRFDRTLDGAWWDAGLGGRAPSPRPSSGGSLRIDVD
ncbi:MAG: hypothetical protein M3198_03220, partial [Actinomycetota bacterium]|nr:hypothetical protein [Actinomycetota bacterium]